VPCRRTSCCGAFDSEPPSDSVIPGGCPDRKTITRTWSYSDGCTGEQSVAQTIHVDDKIPPSITAPHDIYPACEVLAIVTDTTEILSGAIESSDTCSSTTVTSTDSTISQPSTCGKFTRTFVAVDACGNKASAVQRITFVDDTPPEFTTFPGICNSRAAQVPFPATPAHRLLATIATMQLMSKSITPTSLTFLFPESSLREGGWQRINAVAQLLHRIK